MGIVVLGSTSLTAQAPGTTGFEFLRNSPFARSAAMADATSAFAGDALSVFSNPAGLGHLANGEISAQHVGHFQSIRHSHMAAVFTTKHGGWALGAGLMEVPGISRTQTVDPSVSIDRFVESGDVAARDVSLSLGGGVRQTSNFAWGAGLKAVHERLDSNTAVSLLVDAGLIHRTSRRWRTALVLQNAGIPYKHISKTVLPPIRLRGGIYCSPRKWALWEADLVYNIDARWEALLGMEFNLARIGYLRLGYKHLFRDADLGPEVGLTLGGGLRLGHTQADYAFIPFGDLGVSHRLSLSWRLGKLVKK